MYILRHLRGVSWPSFKTIEPGTNTCQKKGVRDKRHHHSPYWWHCKTILNNYQKLCSVVSDEPEFNEHISESFRIYSELDKLISAKKFFTESEIPSVLCAEFGKCTIHFPNETPTRKMQVPIFDVHRFWQSTEHWDTLARKKERVCTVWLIRSCNITKLLGIRTRS